MALFKKNKEETPKKNKEKHIFKKPVESTQQNVPIRDIYKGVFITSNKKYIKVMEVKPQPFFLKKISEQNAISEEFAALLKAGPNELHFKSMSLPADLSYQIDDVSSCVEQEEDPECKKMGQEYIQRLTEAQNYGISRRFFVSIPFTERQNGLYSKDIDEVVHSLNNDARRLEDSLQRCGNEIIREYPDDPDADPLKILYMIYNRDQYLQETFERRYNEIGSRYQEKMKEKYFYIPVNDFISPARISYMSNKYLVINNTYYAFLYIPFNGYTPYAYTGWLSRYITSYPGVDVDIFLKRLPREQVINGIKTSIGHARASAIDSRDTSDSYEQSLNVLGSAEYLKRGLSMGNDFYNMAIILTVSATSPERVSQIIDELKKDAREDDIAFKENVFRAEETFNMVLPTSSWNDDLYTFKKAKRNVLTEGAASVYPFTTFQLTDKNGLYIADDTITGSPVLLDQFNRKRITNPHIFVAGETGAGKTTTLMIIALRARVKKMPVYIIAPEKQDEYKRLTSAIGGQFIDIGAGSNSRINIMEIFKSDETARDKLAFIDGDDEEMEQSHLIRKISTLSDFFSLHIPNISSTEKFDLEEAIVATYAKKGITADNNSLWADPAHTKYKKMPIISDLIVELEAKPDTVRLAKTIKLLTKGNGAHFNGQTNVDINNEFVVIGLQHNSQDMLGLSIFMAMDFYQSKIMEDRTKNKFFVIDECWKLMQNSVSASRVMKLIRTLRAYSTSVILGSQSIEELLTFDDGKYGAAVLNNCATKILMSMKEQSASMVQEIVDLSDKETGRLSRQHPGEALLLAGETRLFMRIMPSETEKLLTFTDRETLMRYAQYKRAQEEKERSKKMSETARDLDDLFDEDEEIDLSSLEDLLPDAMKDALNQEAQP